MHKKGTHQDSGILSVFLYVGRKLILRDRCVLQGASVRAQKNFEIKINSPRKRIKKKEMTGEPQNRSQN
jgi:hypothetical protein